MTSTSPCSSRTVRGLRHYPFIKKECINHLEKDIYIPSEEHIMKHIPNISKYARTSCCSPGPPSPLINERISSKGIRSSHPGAHNLKKVIIKFDIILNIFDSLGHFAQRGHQSPTIIKQDFPAVIKMDIIDSSTTSLILAASVDPTTSPSHQPSILTSLSKQRGSSSPFICSTSTTPMCPTSFGQNSSLSIICWTTSASAGPTTSLSLTSRQS